MKKLILLLSLAALVTVSLPHAAEARVVHHRHAHHRHHRHHVVHRR